MGLIKKLTGQNLNNMTDEQLQQDIYPVTSIKAIYNEFNERLDCILRRQADYNLSLKKAGTTKYSEIVTYPTLSDALSIFTQGTNTYGDATYFGLQDYGTTISFLDNNLNKWRLFKFKFTGGTLTDAEWNNVSNWEEFSMSSDDIDELRKLITALQNSLAETNQNVSSLSTSVTNLQVKEQELDDKKVDKYSTSHYYDITTSRYSYDLQRVVSVPTNDGTYGAVDFTFMGHSGYTEYNDLLMMSTDESEKVVSLMTDLFYTLVENINGKEYVTLCTVNKANPRNLFQFNIDLNKFGSTYNKGVTTTGSDRPDVKNFIWYDNDNTDGRDLKLSDIQTAIAAGDYSKYVALKKGLVIKSSFEDTTLDSKTSCILTISSTDDTAKYKAADLVQYTDFIVKWDNTASKGNLSTFKMQAHTVTETDSSGNQTTSTSYYDASKIYRFSPTSNMNGFTLVGPKDPTNTAVNDSVTLLTYSNSDTKNVIPAGSIVTLTPPATSTDIWLIDVKKPDVYNVDSSIDVEYDEDGRTRVSRDTLIVPFNLPEFISSIPTDLKDKYVAVLKMPYNYSTFRALIGVSIQEGNSPATEPQGGTVHLMFRRGDDLQNSHCFYYGIKSATSTGLTDDAHMDRICFRFADANGDIIDISDTRVVPSTAKYVYLCVCFLSTKGGYVDHFQFSLDQVPYGTSYQGWDYANMLSIGLDDYIKSYATPFTVLDVTYLVPIDGTRVTLNLIESDLNLKIQTLQSSKQDKLTWDTVPTKDSTNDINSGAVYTAIVGKQNKLTFDVTPTDGSLNPVTSDGIYQELIKRIQYIATIVPAYETHIQGSGTTKAGLYIISKTDTEVVGIPDSLGNVCRLPHVAIAYRENPTDMACKWLHIPMQDNDLYKSITLSGNVLTLTKTNGSVETITLPSVDSKGNDIESTYATKTELVQLASEVTNLADDDDLENAIINDVPVIREKTTKSYNPENYSGMGRVILRKNMVNGVNALTQEMINQANTIYEIRYDFDLNGEDITIPEGCTLDFQGGSLRNGSVVGNNTVLKAFPVKIMDCTLQGTFNTPEAYIEWFGGKADNNTDCLQAFNTAVNNFVCIKLLGGTYLVSDTLNIPDYCSIYGETSTVITTNNDINYLLYVERGLSYEKNKARWNNFVIDCNNKANYGIYAKNITNNATAFLQNIEIFNAVTCGLHLETCQLINLYNVLVSSSADKGIVINGCNNARIYNISAIQCEGDGITITKTSIYSGHLYIFGIYSENNNGNGVYIDNINYGMSLISGGWIEGNAKDGVYIDNSTFLIQGLRITGKGVNNNRGLRIIGNKTQIDNIYVARGSGDTTYGEIYLDGNSFVRNNLLGNGNYNISTLSIGKEKNLISNNTLTSGDKWSTHQVTADYSNSEHVNSKSTSLKLTANINRGGIMTYVNGIDGDVNVSVIVYAEVDTSIAINIYVNNVYRTERTFQLVGGEWNNISFKIKMSANFIYRIGLSIPTAQTSIWVDEVNAITQANTYVSHEVYGNNYLYSSLLSTDAIDCTMLESNIDKGTIDFQPTDLTTNDYGFLFFDNTNKRQKVWNGTEFRRLMDVKDVATVGNSSEIPDNLVYNDKGFMYFNTTLKKPIWWDGSKWVDNMGFSANLIKGTTAQRPTLVDEDKGYIYYDTQLSKYIFWNGAAWVNMDGTPLT